jgi:hypothetical protein
MKKNGTLYLAEVVFNNTAKSKSWEIISWKRAIGLSDPYCRKAWCNQSGFALKLFDINKYIELNEALLDLGLKEDTHE